MDAEEEGQETGCRDVVGGRLLLQTGPRVAGMQQEKEVAGSRRPDHTGCQDAAEEEEVAYSWRPDHTGC